MTVRSTEHTSQLHFADIFKRHEYKLYTLVFQLTKSDQYAKDIVQAVFLKLWQRRNNISIVNNAEAFLYRLTEDRIVEFLTRAADDRHLRDAIWVNMHQNIYDVEECTPGQEYNHIIEKAICELPPQRQRIYQLQSETGFHYNDLLKEISRSGFNLTKKAVIRARYFKQYFIRLLKRFHRLFL
ncbi:MAG: RNA polymerase sigma factor [Agriterribacter sp.]